MGNKTTNNTSNVVLGIDQLQRLFDPFVGFSHFDAGESVAQLLLDRSYRKIGFLGARMDRRTCQRRDGFEERLSSVNHLDKKRIITTSEPSSVAMGTSLFRKLMAVTEGDCDAVFCCNDDLAIGVLHECKKLQINVPGQFGVCGFNDIEMAAFTEPALTTVRVNRYKMGSRAMELIFEKTRPTSDKKPITSNYINTGFEVVPRNSTR